MDNGAPWTPKGTGTPPETPVLDKICKYSPIFGENLSRHPHRDTRAHSTVASQACR